LRFRQFVDEWRVKEKSRIRGSKTEDERSEKGKPMKKEGKIAREVVLS